MVSQFITKNAKSGSDQNKQTKFIALISDERSVPQVWTSFIAKHRTNDYEHNNQEWDFQE